jgi:hypothetical protein
LRRCRFLRRITFEPTVDISVVDRLVTLDDASRAMMLSTATFLIATPATHDPAVIGIIGVALYLRF